MPQAPEIASIGTDDLGRCGPHDLSDALELGRIVYFPASPVPLPSEEDLTFLRTELPSLISLKNISFYPDSDRVYGLSAEPPIMERTTRILKAHRDRVDAFLRLKVQAFVRDWVEGTTSFRPLQERGRNLSAHASNELIHIDAGAYGATHGARIFRYFTNINPTEPRVWRCKGTFPDLLADFGRAARVPTGTMREGLFDRAYSGLVRGVSALVPRARALDTSPYDRAMRRMHNYMKESADFQQGDAGARTFEFAPMSAWMVFTDMVGHSCTSGQHMLSNTYVIPRENCRRQELTPYACLSRAAPAR